MRLKNLSLPPRWLPPALAASLALLAWPGLARADDALNNGDIAWMLTSCALVLLMTPGLAFFYAGMVRTKNTLSTIMFSFIAMAVMSLQWVLFGYSLAFGDSVGGFIGNLKFFGLSGVGLEPKGTIPHLLFMMFQGMFAIITPALISGAMVERIKFSSYVLFILLWGTLVYDPVCHWVWGGGWLMSRGALDFAGGTVVHLISGVSALVAAVVLGRRKGWPQQAFFPHNLTLTTLGAGLLWFGWFGFNAGSALTAGTAATVAFVTTHIAASAAALSWAIVERLHRGKSSVLGVASGLVAGLVVITPAAGFVSPMSALLMGLMISPVCYGAIMMKTRFHYDDALDAFGIHGVGGAFGAILTGIFAHSVWAGSENIKGLIQGNGHQLWVQFEGVAVAALYAAGVTWILLKLIDKTLGLRPDEESEVKGLDVTQHGESAYEL